MNNLLPGTDAHMQLNNLCQLALGCNIIKFQTERGLTVDNIIGMKTYTALYNAILNPTACKCVQFPSPLNKRQLVIHHTAGADNGLGIYQGWERDNMASVATSIVIDRAGKTFKGFDESLWAHHLGTKLPNNTALNQSSIAVELTNWGAATFKEGQFFNYLNRPLDENDLVEVTFRQYKYWQAYTPAQLQTLEHWLVLNASRFNIPLDYQEDMWDLSPRATNGQPGIFTHVSYRRDKLDCSPQPALIQMLQSLKRKYNPLSV